MKRAIAVTVFAFLAIGGTARATDGGWGRYKQTNDQARVTHVRIRAACIDAEDSAAHLRLREYGDGRAVYGCDHNGY